MYELVQCAADTFYIQCPAKVGVYRLDAGGRAILIDSGSDKDAGRRIQKALDSGGLKPESIIVTHGNADHSGGAAMLSDRLGVPVYAPGIDAAVVAHPELEPAFLYGGYPFKALRNKFLMAKPCDARDTAELALPSGMETFPLPGHFFDMIGVKTPDDVYFLADSLFSPEVLDKYHAAFVYDVKGQLETLDMLEALAAPEGSFFVPAHAQPCSELAPLVRANRDKLNEVLNMLLDIIQTPLCFEHILARFMNICGLSLDFNQYVLVGSTVRSMLSYLLDAGMVKASFEDNVLLWSSDL